jgi:CheY-like chemotaxis protein
MRNACPDLTGRNLLLVDDSPGILYLLEEVFAPAGARIRSASDGKAALAALEDQGFDLVILDLVMPRPNGWDILETIQARHPELLGRILLLTGDRYGNQCDAEGRIRGLPLLYKPFRLDDLRRAVEDVLTQAGADTVSHPAGCD